MRISANGTELFYEKTGSGRPLILLHGNGESHEIFSGLAGLLADRFTVYAVDSRCHGMSGGGELDYELMADDIAALIEREGIKGAFLYGFSDGGIVGLILALKHKGCIDKLIISGANLNPGGLKRRYTALYRFIHFFTRSKFIRLMLTAPDIDAEALKKIDIPVLITAGKRDIIKERHTRLIASSIKNSALMILEGENHFSYVKDSRKLHGIIEQFLLN